MGLIEGEDFEDRSDDVSVQLSVSSVSLLSRFMLISSFLLSAIVIAVASSNSSTPLQSETLGILLGLEEGYLLLQSYLIGYIVIILTLEKHSTCYIWVCARCESELEFPQKVLGFS